MARKTDGMDSLESDEILVCRQVAIILDGMALHVPMSTAAVTVLEFSSTLR
jgi:hypothetical protein